MNKLFLTFFVSIVLSILSPLVILAQQTLDTIQLSGVEIQGARIDNDQQIRLSRIEIEQISLPDIGYVLRNVAGINGIRKGGVSIDPVLRGFRFSQLSVIANQGTKIEGGCPNRMDPTLSHIETDDIESIDIIKGPYLLRYGPVLGGLIQINTFQPQPYEKFEIHGKFHTSASSNPGGFGQYALINGGNQKVYFGVSGSYRDYGNYTDGNGNEVFSFFKKYSVKANIGVRTFRNQELLLSFASNLGRDIRFPALPMDEIIDNTSLFSLDYKMRKLTNNLEKLDISFYLSDVYHEMDNSFRPNYNTVVPPYTGKMQAVAKVDAANYGGRIEAQYLFGNHQLIAGLDSELVTKDGERTTKMIMVMNGQETVSTKLTNLWKGSQIFNSGIYGEYSHHLLNYDLKTSLRIDFNQANSEDTLKLISTENSYFNGTSSNFLNFSGNFGITRHIGGHHAISVYLGRGMRSPDMTERYIKYLIVGFDSYDYLGNPELEPEINYQADVIANIDLRHYGKLIISGFASMIENYISGVVLPQSVAQPKSMGAVGVKQFSNTGKAWFYGFESTYNSPEVKGLITIISLAYTHGVHSKVTRNIFENNQVTGQEEIVNDAILEIPPFEAQIAVKYQFFKRKMAIGLNTRLVASQKHVSLAFYENTTPGFALVNATVGFKVTDNFSVMAGVNNLFNNYYYEHLNRRVVGSSIRLYEPGRNLYLNLNINF